MTAHEFNAFDVNFYLMNYYFETHKMLFELYFILMYLYKRLKCINNDNPRYVWHIR